MNKRICLPLLPAALAAGVVLLAARGAAAKPNDITLNRLVLTTCPNGATYCEDQQSFRSLMREFGYAVSPNHVLPAETLGFGGGFFGMLGHVTFISNDAYYWQQGVQEKSPDKSLFLYQATGQFVMIPYVMEWGFTLGYLFTTADTTIGFNAKISPFEGFRKKIPGYFPDISLGLGINRLVGDDEISLTTGNAELNLSWSFAPGGVVVLTPFASVSYVAVVAESELVDTTPAVNAASASRCPIHVGNTKLDVNCPTSAGYLDYNNSLKFSREWIHFIKGQYGIRLIYELLSVSIMGSHGHQVARKSGDPSNVIGQLSFAIGLDF